MSRKPPMQLWRDLVLFDGEQTCPQPMAVWVQDGRIAGLCPDAEFDAAALSDVREVGRGGVMTPGLVDCHTHLVYAGNRAREFEQRLPLLRGLNLPLVIDHQGKFLVPPTPQEPAFQALCRLMEAGGTWVKLSAPYETSRTGAPHYEDVAALARHLAKHYPERCLWASNWPHPNQHPAPSSAALLSLLPGWLSRPGDLQRILVDNPAALYGFEA